MVAKNYLPNEIVNSPKKVFHYQLMFGLKKFDKKLAETFDSKKINAQAIFNNDYLQYIIKEHINGRRNHKSLLWKLYVFQNWYDNSLIKLEMINISQNFEKNFTTS